MDKDDLQNECCEHKEAILNRLNRIEGQVKGIQRMVEQEKSCVDILTQIAAVRAAINKVGGLILEKYSKTCVQNVLESEEKEQVLKDFINTVEKFIKFVD